MPLKCQLKPSNDLLLGPKLLLIDCWCENSNFSLAAARSCESAHAPLRALRPRGCGCAQGPVPTAENSSAPIQPRSRERGAHSELKMDGVGSFGAGRTGSTVDPIAFAKQPQTILRVLSWVSVFPPLRCCLHLMRVCERRGAAGGVFSVVAAWVPWRPLTANMDHRNPAIIEAQAVQMYLRCGVIAGKYARGWNHKGPAVIWNPDCEIVLRTDQFNFTELII